MEVDIAIDCPPDQKDPFNLSGKFRVSADDVTAAVNEFLLARGFKRVSEETPLSYKNLGNGEFYTRGMTDPKTDVSGFAKDQEGNILQVLACDYDPAGRHYGSAHYVGL